MDPRLLRAYNDELAYLRESAKEFGAEHEVVAGYLGLHALRESPLAARRTVDIAVAPLRLREAARNPDFVAALTATTSVQWSVVGIRSSLVPLFIVGPLGLAREWSYVCFFVVSIVTGVLLTPSGRRADSHSRLVMLAGGLLVEATALVLLPSVPHLYGLLPAMVLLGTAGAVLSVVPGAIVGNVVGQRSGTVVASYQMAGDAGSVAGPLVAGFLADRYGFAVSFYVAAVVVTVLPLLAVARAARARGRTVDVPVDGKDGRPTSAPSDPL